jgi:hypothetical protein
MNNLCYSCEKPVRADDKMVGRYICANGRCNRFGLVSTIMIQPKQVQGVPKKDDTNIQKDRGSRKAGSGS